MKLKWHLFFLLFDLQYLYPSVPLIFWHIFFSLFGTKEVGSPKQSKQKKSCLKILKGKPRVFYHCLVTLATTEVQWNFPRHIQYKVILGNTRSYHKLLKLFHKDLAWFLRKKLDVSTKSCANWAQMISKNMGEIVSYQQWSK